ncbi:MAG: DUF4956 domain-containing protein [Eubacteriales bacterium]|nr:DUF4956 domain-containing protein [Eubacteriales bacterium]
MKEVLYQYFSHYSGALTVQDVLLSFLVAAIISVVIFLAYRLTHSGTTYSARFNVSLVQLTLVTTLVMNVIGNNVALSLGMVGALSIVRFRTAIKDPRDTAYIFWGIAVGICCGVAEFMIAGIGSAVILFYLLIFGHVKSNERFLFIVRGALASAEEIEKYVETVFSGAAKLKVQNTTESTVEFIYEASRSMVNAAKKGGDPVKGVYKIAGITAANLVCQNDEINS